jgi:drug/metabolite transporter (DMT)-like permease
MPGQERVAMLSYVFAVVAACANATSSVLQRKANLEVPRSENLSWRLVWSLMHQPVWFGGILAITAGFLLQASALGSGQLAAVEPILVVELPFTLILASRVFHRHLGWGEWLPAVLMTAGLAGMLYLLSPSSGHSQHIRWYVWLIGIGANLLLIGGLVVSARRWTPPDSSRRAALLGVAAGAGFGMTAALIKGMTDQYSHGFIALLTSWQLYAMIAAGALGMFLAQSAMNAGSLVAAQPGLTLTDPVVSVVWGVLVFHEHVRGGLYGGLAAVCGIIIAGAAVGLARSPLLSESPQQQEKQHEKAAGLSTG